MKIRFAVKDGQNALLAAVGELLGQDAPSRTYSAGGYLLKCTTRRGTKKGVDLVNIRFNVMSAGRKAFARAVGEILGEEAVYCGTPSFAYQIGRYVVDRGGELICPADEEPGEANRLIAALRERGYEADKTPDYADDPNTLAIDMPLDGFTPEKLDNLNKLVESKATLIKKALGADSLPVQITGDKLRFPWFTLTGADGEMDAYLRFVTALCQMAKKLQRVTAKEKEVENDKFSFRLFLIRLGFIGVEYKTARKILLRNLTGNTAWKDGQRPERAVCGVEQIRKVGEL